MGFQISTIALNQRFFNASNSWSHLFASFRPGSSNCSVSISEEVFEKSFKQLEMVEHFQEGLLMCPPTEVGFCDCGSKPYPTYSPRWTFVQDIREAMRLPSYLSRQREKEQESKFVFYQISLKFEVFLVTFACAFHFPDETGCPDPPWGGAGVEERKAHVPPPFGYRPHGTK